MSRNELSILDRINIAEQAATAAIAQSSSTSKTNDNSYNKMIICANILAPAFWLYLLINTFIINLDSILLRYMPGMLAHAINYKFFTFLIISTIFAILLKNYILLYLYILFYPLIVLFWKLPKFIYHFRSWILLLSITELITSMFSKFKIKLITTTLTLVGFLAIVSTKNSSLLTFSIVVLALLMLYLVYITIYSSFISSVFFSMQAKMINKFQNSGFAQKLILIDDKIKDSKSKQLTKEQSTAVLGTLQSAVLLHRLIYFWAYQLEKYRSSKIGFILNGISYLWLYLKLIIFLSFINFGIYKLDPTNFLSQNDTFISFMHYSITSLFFNEINQLTAVSDLSIIVRIFSGLIGYLLVGVFALNIIITAKQNRDDLELDSAIKAIKKEGKNLSGTIKQEYQVSTYEVIDRLRELKAGFLSLILLITSQLPENFLDDEKS